MPVPLERAIEELFTYRRGLQNDERGGSHFSGGEPLMQDRFAVRLFVAAKKMGIHTALDTNGFLGDRLSDAELNEIDLVLLDIKTFDSAHHKRLTGKDVEQQLNFASRLARLDRPISQRFVLVPGLTDDEQGTSTSSPNSRRRWATSCVDVLPFHQMGQFKWKKLGSITNSKPRSRRRRSC